MLKSEHQKRLEAHIDLACKGVRSTADFLINERLFGVPPRDVPSVEEIHVETSISIPVHPTRNVRSAGFFRSEDTEFLHRTIFQFEKGHRLYRRIFLPEDGSLGDYIVDECLKKGQEAISSEEMAELGSWDDEAKRVLVVSQIHTEAREYTIDSSGQTYAPMPFPYYQISMRGNDELLGEKYRISVYDDLEFSRVITDVSNSDISSLLVFDHDDHEGFAAVQEYLTSKASRHRIAFWNEEIALDIAPQHPMRPLLTGIRAIGRAIANLGIKDTEDKKLIKKFAKILEYRSQPYTSKEMGELSDLCSELDTVVSDKYEAEFTEMVERYGWQLTISPFEVATHRLQTYLNPEAVTSAAPRM